MLVRGSATLPVFVTLTVMGACHMLQRRIPLILIL